MPRTLTTAAVALAVALAASCSSGDNSADAFCTDIADTQDDLLNAATADPGTIADGLAQTDPPDEIADAYNNVLDLYQDIRDNPDALTNPDNATRFADLNQDITAIEDYIRTTCDPDR